MTTIGERLRQIRLTLGKTQGEIATILKVGKATWQNYEYGTTMPSYAVLSDLSDQGFDMNWMVSGRGGMYQTLSVAEGSNLPDIFRKQFLQKAYDQSLKHFLDQDKPVPQNFSKNVFQEVEHILKTASTEEEANLLFKHYLSRL